MDKKKMLLLISSVLTVFLLSYALKSQIMESKVIQFTIGVRDNPEIVELYEETRNVVMAD